jgi:Zn ribbon nucleic-acid-binding protein
MEDYPKTLLEVEERFSTEEACREYLFMLRWPSGFRCPCCDHQKFWVVRDLYECTECGFQTSITAGTIFQDTKKPLRLWFRTVLHITSQKYGANA